MSTLFPGSGDNSLGDLYRVTLASPGTLTVTLESAAFDAFVALLPGGMDTVIAFDDDSAGGGNARMTMALGTGTYVIVANSALITPDTGPYTLTLTFAPDIWAPTSSVGAPDPRTEHTAVWTGAEMIVWGGHDGNSNAKNSGGRFDPVSNTWTSMSTVGAPSARWGHTAIWTGNEMIVWGGFGGAPDFLALGDGAKYNPQTDTWSPLSAINQPSPRLGHTAVWTGSEMIVWGGFSCTACISPELATGARYDLANDEWASTSLDPVASARGNHTAIWTGERMIVWGGENETGLIGSGASYDPAADDWLPTTATNAPVPTRCHTAAWTGSEMILFGGQTDRSLACGTSSNGNGARYDPVAEAWNAMAPAPVSSTLSGAPAAWTGDRLITWFEIQGGRYNLLTDDWDGVSTIGAPASRRRHTLVWTGSRLVVWGGDLAGPLDSGGMYDPNVDSTP